MITVAPSAASFGSRVYVVAPAISVRQKPGEHALTRIRRGASPALNRVYLSRATKHPSRSHGVAATRAIRAAHVRVQRTFRHPIYRCCLDGAGRRRLAGEQREQLAKRRGSRRRVHCGARLRRELAVYLRRGGGSRRRRGGDADSPRRRRRPKKAKAGRRDAAAGTRVIRGGGRNGKDFGAAARTRAPEFEDTCTTCAPSLTSGRNASVTDTTPSKLTRSVSSTTSASGVPSLSRSTPALFTMASSVTRGSSVCSFPLTSSTAAATDAGSVTSSCTGRTPETPFSDARDAASASPSARLRQPAKTRMPSFDSASTTARPMPLVPPVT